MKITIEANSFLEVKQELDKIFTSPTVTATLAAPASTDQTQEPKKTRAKKETAITEATPLDKSNAEHKAAASKPTYADLSKAVMEAVVVHDKPPVLAILREYKHKEGGDMIVNSPMDIAEADYAEIIDRMVMKAKEAKAA